MTRKVPKRIESPIPENGAIKAALTELIESGSIAEGLFAYCYSIAEEIPIIIGVIAGVQLNKAKWRFNAAALSFVFEYSLLIAGSIAYA